MVTALMYVSVLTMMKFGEEFALKCVRRSMLSNVRLTTS